MMLSEIVASEKNGAGCCHGNGTQTPVSSDEVIRLQILGAFRFFDLENKSKKVPRVQSV